MDISANNGPIWVKCHARGCCGLRCEKGNSEVPCDGGELEQANRLPKVPGQCEGGHIVGSCSLVFQLSYLSGNPSMILG